MKKYFGLMLFTLLFSSTVSADDSDVCAIKMENAAVYAFAQQIGRSVGDIEVLRFEMGGWTEMTGNNTGSAQVDLAAGKNRGYFEVFARQIGDSSDCEASGVNPVDVASIDPIILQAERYKSAIKKAQYYSESEAEWSVFYSRDTVGKSFPLDEVKTALRSGDLPVQVLNHKEALESLDGYINDEDQDFMERHAYRRLKEELLKDFKSLRAFRVGVPDSGAIDVYLIGRTKDGRLVGLKTVSVET